MCLCVKICAGKRVFVDHTLHYLGVLPQPGKRKTTGDVQPAYSPKSNLHPAVKGDFFFDDRHDAQRSQISQRIVRQRRVVYNLRFHDGKQNQHHPKQKLHPAPKIELHFSLRIRQLKKCPHRKYRSRKTAHQQDHKMVTRKTTMPGVGGTEQTVLVTGKFSDEPGAIFDGFDAEP